MGVGTREGILFDTHSLKTLGSCALVTVWVKFRSHSFTLIFRIQHRWCSMQKASLGSFSMHWHGILHWVTFARVSNARVHPVAHTYASMHRSRQNSGDDAFVPDAEAPPVPAADDKGGQTVVCACCPRPLCSNLHLQHTAEWGQIRSSRVQYYARSCARMIRSHDTCGHR